jgi:hypothetical protein
LALLTARMLSTRLGYLRPAFLAVRFAPAFAAGESFLEVSVRFFGSAFFQGAFRAAMSTFL